MEHRPLFRFIDYWCPASPTISVPYVTVQTNALPATPINNDPAREVSKDDAVTPNRDYRKFDDERMLLAIAGEYRMNQEEPLQLLSRRGSDDSRVLRDLSAFPRIVQLPSHG